jgi:hypothetical protein
MRLVFASYGSPEGASPLAELWRRSLCNRLIDRFEIQRREFAPDRVRRKVSERNVFRQRPAIIACRL